MRGATFDAGQVACIAKRFGLSPDGVLGNIFVAEAAGEKGIRDCLEQDASMFLCAPLCEGGFVLWCG